MFNRNVKNKDKKLIDRKIFTVLAVVFLILLSFPLARNISQRRAVNEEIQGLKEELESLKNKNSELSNLLDYLESSQFTESKARLEFGLRKEGEKVVVIDTTGESAGGENGSENEAGEGEGDGSAINPARWWKYFFAK